MTYRIGRKQKRAILTEDGHEVVVFAKGKEDMAELVCRLLNEHSANTPVSGSLSFKEQMVNDIIPFVERMIGEEKNHLYWLESINAPKEFIEKSKWHLNHFRQRHKKYIEYADGL